MMLEKNYKEMSLEEKLDFGWEKAKSQGLQFEYEEVMSFDGWEFEVATEEEFYKRFTEFMFKYVYSDYQREEEEW